MTVDESPARNGAAAHVPEAEGDERISVFQIGSMVLRNWRILLVLPGILAVLVMAINMANPRQYLAAASFVPNAVSTESQLGSLAQQFGMRLNTSAAGQSPSFYRSLLTSRDILRDVALTTYTVSTADGRVRRGNLIKLFDLEPEPGTEPTLPSPLDNAIMALRGAITASEDFETSRIDLTVSTESPALSEQIANRLIQLTQTFDLTKRRTQATARRRFAEAQLAAARQELTRKQAAVEAFVSSNRLYAASPVLMAEYGKLMYELSVVQQVHIALLQAYEQARLDEVRDTPVITIVESPTGSAVAQSRGTLLRGILAATLGLLIAMGIALMRELSRRARTEGSDDFREFVELRGAVIRDLGRFIPGRRKRTAKV